MRQVTIDARAACRYTVRMCRGLFWTLLLLLTACREDPAVVVVHAREALAAHDDAAFIALCEPQAAALLRAVPRVERQSGHLWHVWREGRPTSRLLPDGDLVDVRTDGQRAVVTVQTKKPDGQVPLRLVDGRWRLDLLTMPQFRQAVRPAL